MNPDPTLQKVNQLLKVVGDGLTRKDFEDAFKHVVGFVMQMREELSALNQHEIGKLKAEIATLKRDALNDTAKDRAELKSAVSAALKDQQRGMNFIHDKTRTLKNGKNGTNGKDGKPGKDGSPDTPEQVRNKLHALPQGSRLHADFIDGLEAERIGNLPSFIRNNLPIAPTTGSLSHMGDVDMSGIASGQALKWDGMKFVPYTPSGASTAVYAEDLTKEGSGTSFTLANTPVSGTVRLYRGGSRITVANGDYTISGAAITLTTALGTGETLTADYNY